MTFASERRLAEQSLAAIGSSSPPSSLRWPPVGQRIREARRALGRTDADVAKQVGISVPSYRDLETRDEEAFTALSLRDLARLGRELNVSPSFLLFGEGGAEEEQGRVTFEELSSRLKDHRAASGLSVEQLGESIGWDMHDVLSNSEALWSFNLVGLRDVCSAVDVDWVTVLPNKIPRGDSSTP